MSEQTGQIGFLIVGHGSPRAHANEGFISLVGRVAERMSAPVLPTFFSIARPSIDEQVENLAGRGVRRIVIMPYFLYSGQHVSRDIPELIAKCRQTHPEVQIDVLPTLENEPALEELLVERLAPLAGEKGVTSLLSAGEKGVTSLLSASMSPAEIERRSLAAIDARLERLGLSGDAKLIARRVVHATADLSFARTLRIHPQAVARGVAALAGGAPIVCDVQMVAAGVTKAGVEALCAISDADVAAAASAQGCTRAAAAMEKLAPRLAGAIVAIGNAPTALYRVLDIARRGGPTPAVVVGLPVGFVGALESKLALLESPLCYVTNVSPRGGSPVAAAAVNALAIHAREDQ